MWDRTIILFTSDNGGLMCWDVGSVNTCSGSVNLPLRGGKGTLFEGSLRVRTILSGGYIDESLYGTSNDQLMHSTDLFSTLLNAANVANDIIYNIYNNDASISNNIGNKKQVKGLPFWDYITRKNTEAPIRGDPFIVTYIEQAALYWKGYKYIIQPLELYDGWWQSPLQGPMEMPSDAAGVQTEPQPLQDSGTCVNANPNLFGNIWYPFEEEYRQ